jgi:hypothetical protein
MKPSNVRTSFPVHPYFQHYLAILPPQLEDARAQSGSGEWSYLRESKKQTGTLLLLEGDELRSYRLDLADNVGGDELLQVENTDVVEQTEVEVLELERGEVESAENAELVDLEEGVQRLQLEKALKVEGLLLEEALELQNVEVVDAGQVAKEAELQGVDVEQVVQVDLVEVLEAVEGVDVELKGARLKAGGGSRGSRRGGDSQGGESRDDEGNRLHFVGGGEI